MAIAIARRAYRSGLPRLVSLDLAMSAVLCAAIEGNAAAALMLAYLLKRRRARDPACGALADGWFAYKAGKRAATLH